MLFQSQIHSIRPLTTAHLAQTMTLLGLSSQELRQKVESELAANPALELSDAFRCPTCRRRLPGPVACPVCSRPKLSGTDEPVVFVSSREDFRGAGSHRSEADSMPEEEWTAASEDLPTYVLRQIAAELSPQDRPLAAHLLTSLDEDGLLTISRLEVARFHHVLPSRVDSVVRLIQRADPLGVGSSTPQEALVVQLEVLAETQRVHPMTRKAVEEGMGLMSRRAYAELARLLNVPITDAQSIARFIGENLNPYPGRTHWGDRQSCTPGVATYQHPDVLINCQHGMPEAALVVEIISPYAGRLRVNPLFREALAQAPEDRIHEWQADLEQASLLVKCIQQRDHTLVRLMQRVVQLQRKFILHGDAYLNPVTRAQLADELEVHESTISRAVSAKSVQLPNGHIVPLSKFFDRSLHVRTALRQIIDQEREPLSDGELSDMLRKQGFDVARRTVAKYRAMEGILPARFRNNRGMMVAA